MDAKAICYEKQKNTLIKDFFETDITDFQGGQNSGRFKQFCSRTRKILKKNCWVAWQLLKKENGEIWRLFNGYFRKNNSIRKSKNGLYIALKEKFFEIRAYFMKGHNGDLYRRLKDYFFRSFFTW